MVELLPFTSLLCLNKEQECIPVGYILPAAVVVVGWGGGLVLIPLNFPLGCGPGSDPPQFPP